MKTRKKCLSAGWQGFTLIELLVTISILGILASIAMVVYSGVTTRARDNQRINALQSIKQALEFYKGDKRYYPNNYNPSTGALTSSGNTYINCVKDSSDTSTYTCSPSSRWYAYKAFPDTPTGCTNMPNVAPGYCTSFILCAKKEGNDSFPDTPAGCSALSCGSSGGQTVFCDIGISSQ